MLGLLGCCGARGGACSLERQNGKSLSGLVSELGGACWELAVVRLDSMLARNVEWSFCGIQHMAHAAQVASTEYRAQHMCSQASHELGGSGSAKFSHVEVKVRHDYAKPLLDKSSGPTPRPTSRFPRFERWPRSQRRFAIQTILDVRALRPTASTSVTAAAE